MDLQNMQFIASSRTIVSIYPEVLTAQRDFGPTFAGGKTTYRLDGAKKGEFSTLVITDSFESIINEPMCQHVGNYPRTGRFESAEVIARDLLREWTTGAGCGPGEHPGVMIIQKPEPSKQEVDHLTAIQSRCFEFLVREADGYANKHAWRDINEKHRIASKWLGLERAWTPEVGAGAQMKSCPHCYERIDVRATFCKGCKQAVDVPVVPPVKAPVEKVFKTTAVATPPLAPPLQSPAGA